MPRNGRKSITVSAASHRTVTAVAEAARIPLGEWIDLALGECAGEVDLAVRGAFLERERERYQRDLAHARRVHKPAPEGRAEADEPHRRPAAQADAQPARSAAAAQTAAAPQ